MDSEVVELVQSEPRRPTVKDFLAKHNVQLQKANERPWGSYELTLSINGGPWLNPTRTFGWGYSLEQAAEIVFAETMRQQQARDAFKTLVTEELFKDLEEIFDIK